MTAELDVPQRMKRVEELVHEIEAVADPRVRSCAVELVSSLMEVHGAGLARMLEVLEQTGHSDEVVDRYAHDPLVASLLLLYGLHPVDFEFRILQAREKVRPLLKSQGGNVELLSIDDGVVRLRLQGSCHGCPSSAMTLKNSIEEAIYEFAPDIAELQVEGSVPEAVPAPAGFVPLEQVVMV